MKFRTQFHNCRTPDHNYGQLLNKYILESWANPKPFMDRVGKVTLSRMMMGRECQDGGWMEMGGWRGHSLLNTSTKKMWRSGGNNLWRFVSSFFMFVCSSPRVGNKGELVSYLMSHIGPSGVSALPVAAGTNVSGHYCWHFFSFFLLLYEAPLLLYQIIPQGCVRGFQLVMGS